jgi:hypothetical protein
LAIIDDFEAKAVQVLQAPQFDLVQEEESAPDQQAG